MVMNTDFILVLVTTANKEEAEKIVQKLLEDKLIACANILDHVTSHFHWLGKIDCAEECLVVMKSRLDLFKALMKCVKGLHSYDVPEVLALPIVAGSEAYLGWMDDVLK
jgi:periplasmic divalent cation tolerance protein